DGDEHSGCGDGGGRPRALFHGVDQAARDKRYPEGRVQQGGDKGADRQHPQQSVFQHMGADALDGADDDGYHDDLNAQQQPGQAGLAGDEALIEPCRRQHQDEARQHEAEACQEAADPPARHHAHVDAQLVGFGAGKRLHYGQKPVEARTGNPPLFVDQGAADHGDLGYGAAERQEAEPQEFEKQRRQRKAGRTKGVRRRRHGLASRGRADVEDNVRFAHRPSRAAATACPSIIALPEADWQGDVLVVGSWRHRYLVISRNSAIACFASTGSPSAAWARQWSMWSWIRVFFAAATAFSMA
ncbi:hypothetical protein LTR94_028682, partial [Friedmanniomyces endolithicus]